MINLIYSTHKEMISVPIDDKSLLGVGPAFPYNRSITGGVETSEGLQRINQSLFIIFETPKGSRLMMPEFGSDLRKHRFDPLDRVLMERVRYIITEDIRRWEPRISVSSIEFLTDDVYVEQNILYVSINYKVISTNVMGNYVYPYKLETYDTNQISYR